MVDKVIQAVAVPVVPETPPVATPVVPETPPVATPVVPETPPAEAPPAQEFVQVPKDVHEANQAALALQDQLFNPMQQMPQQYAQQPQQQVQQPPLVPQQQFPQPMQQQPVPVQQPQQQPQPQISPQFAEAFAAGDAAGVQSSIGSAITQQVGDQVSQLMQVMPQMVADMVSRQVVQQVQSQGQIADFRASNADLFTPEHQAETEATMAHADQQLAHIPQNQRLAMVAQYMRRKVRPPGTVPVVPQPQVAAPVANPPKFAQAPKQQAGLGEREHPVFGKQT